MFYSRNISSASKDIKGEKAILIASLEEGDSMTTVAVDPNFSIDVEANLLSRLLSAISTHSNLPDALMSFHADLPENEAVLRETNSHTNHSAGRIGMAIATKRSLVERFVFLGCLVAGVVVVALSFIGSIATYHYLMANYDPFQ